MSKEYIGKTCPYCKTPLTEKDAVVVCNVCDMPHHLSCWQDNQGCTTFGCTGSIKEIIGNVPVTPAAPTPAKPAEKPIEVLSESAEMIFFRDLPLVLEGTALILDRTKEKLFARCTFRSITDQPIKAVLAQILCQDVWGSAVGEAVSCQYLDLKTARDSKFGQSDPIELPDKTTRNIQVMVQKVMFADGTVLSGGEVDFTMPAPIPLAQRLGSEAMAAQYARQTTPQAQFVPEEGERYWLCSCGALNENAAESCYHCAGEKALLLAALEPETLRANLQAFEKERAAAAAAAKAEQDERIRLAEEEVRREQEEKEKQVRLAQWAERKKKRRKKALIISIVSVVLIAAITCGTIFFGIPYYHYHNACVALENEQYDTAFDGFAALNGFLDSTDLAYQALYRKGEAALKNKQFDIAIQSFTKLGKYKDSPDRVLEAKYQKAADCREKEKFKDAYLLYVELGDYKDSKDNVLATIILWEAKALGASTIGSAVDFYLTVKLKSEHYQLFYATILLFLEAHEDVDFWYDFDNYDGATVATQNAQRMLKMLPSTYEDTATLQKLFNLLTTTSSVVLGEKLFRENESLMRTCWSLAFVQDLAEQDRVIIEFLTSYWTGSGYYLHFYEDEDGGGTWCNYDLPMPSQPSGAKYYNIEDMTFYWDDKDLEHLKKVYRFEFVDYDTIRVYCYKNNRTYTMYRN